MKRIFTYTKLLVLTLCLYSLSSCSLDEKLYGVSYTDGFIQSDTLAHFIVSGAYAPYSSFGLYKSSGLGVILYSGDDVCVGDGAAYSTGNPGWYTIRNYDATSNHLLGVWQGYYKAIDNANSAIKALQEAPISEELRDRAIGEMHFIRGFTYFNLVRAYGGVPIRTEPVTGDSDFYIQRATVDQVYEQVFRDLTYATEHCIPLSKMKSNELGRATKGAAEGMLALAYLTYGNYCDMYKSGFNSVVYYTKAKQHAQNVINSQEYVLVDNYADLFDVDKEADAYKTEVMFGIQFARDNVKTNAESIGSELANYLQPRDRPNICGNLLGRGSEKSAINPWFIKQYFEGDYYDAATKTVDYRVNVSFLTEWMGSTKNDPDNLFHCVTYPIVVPKGASGEPSINRKPMPYIDKYQDPKGIDARNHENDFFIMRFSEMYLILAEAENELNGPTPEAFNAFNELRKRARKADGTSRDVPHDLAGPLTQDEFRMAVFNERGLEFVGEGHRYFDAIRTRTSEDPTTSMLEWRYKTFYPSLSSEQRMRPRADSNTGVWDEGIVAVSEANMFEWNDRYLLFPIPSDELSKNPNFGSQNPGW